MRHQNGFHADRLSGPIAVRTAHLFLFVLCASSVVYCGSVSPVEMLWSIYAVADLHRALRSHSAQYPAC